MVLLYNVRMCVCVWGGGGGGGERMILKCATRSYCIVRYVGNYLRAQRLPSRHMPFIQRRLKVDAKSVALTLY